MGMAARDLVRQLPAEYQQTMAGATETLHTLDTRESSRAQQTHRYHPPPHPVRPEPEEKLIDVRTHTNIFRSYIAFEAQWLDLWGSQNADQGNCNAHCVRALYKWEELKAKARAKKRAERRRRKAAAAARKK